MRTIGERITTVWRRGCILTVLCAWAAAPAWADAAEWGALIEPAGIEPTDELRAIAGPDIQRAFTVDFTGDGADDFLVWVPYTGPDVPGKTFRSTEFWIRSDLTVARTRRLLLTSSYKQWFVNLDADPELEILVKSEYENGSEFLLHDQTDDLRGQEALLHVRPILVSSAWGGVRHVWLSTTYFGQMKAIRGDGPFALACAFDSDVYPPIELQVSPLPATQAVLPILLFQMWLSPPRPHGLRLVVHSEVSLTLPELVAQSRVAPVDDSRDVVPVTGPTLVVFVPESFSREDEASVREGDIVDELQWQMVWAEQRLEKMGVRVYRRQGPTIRLDVAGESVVFQPSPGEIPAGIYMVAPDRTPKIVYGAHTYEDGFPEAVEVLAAQAAAYFGFDTPQE